MITIEEKRCRVIHYTKVVRVTLSEILLRTKKVLLLIQGENLKIHYLDHDEIIISGNIKKVVFEDVLSK